MANAQHTKASRFVQQRLFSGLSTFLTPRDFLRRQTKQPLRGVALAQDENPFGDDSRTGVAE